MNPKEKAMFTAILDPNPNSTIVLKHKKNKTTLSQNIGNNLTVFGPNSNHSKTLLYSLHSFLLQIINS